MADSTWKQPKTEGYPGIGPSVPDAARAFTSKRFLTSQWVVRVTSGQISDDPSGSEPIRSIVAKWEWVKRCFGNGSGNSGRTDPRQSSSPSVGRSATCITRRTSHATVTVDPATALAARTPHQLRAAQEVRTHPDLRPRLRGAPNWSEAGGSRHPLPTRGTRGGSLLGRPGPPCPLLCRRAAEEREERTDHHPGRPLRPRGLDPRSRRHSAGPRWTAGRK
ncbi:hypothetical protein M2284_003380 [Rhodococcus sp. LBL1]|nr:hypothetical protein [Rhodococcus sp. LBL1]MDH6685096.1 hypothetical protein [Rhodococcus sp. LBL2]